MLLNDSPFPFPFLNNSGPSYLFPVCRLSFPGIYIIENTIKPGDVSACGKIDMNIIQLVTNCLKVRAGPERGIIPDRLRSKLYSFIRGDTDKIGVTGNGVEKQGEIFLDRPAEDIIDCLSYCLVFFRFISHFAAVGKKNTAEND